MSHAQTDLGASGRSRHGRTRLFDLLRGAGAVVGGFVVLWANRRAVHRLATFDDRMLSDIAVSRADIDWALSQPWHVDPSLALSRRVEGRRDAARWARRFEVAPRADQR